MHDFKKEVNMWMCNCIWLFMFMISPILRQCVEGLFVRCLGISMLSMDSSHQWELQRPGSPMSGHMLGQLYSRLQCYCHGSGFVIIISERHHTRAGTYFAKDMFIGKSGMLRQALWHNTSKSWKCLLLSFTLECCGVSTISFTALLN